MSVFLFTALSLLSAHGPDHVVLMDGKRLDGRLLLDSPTALVFRSGRDLLELAPSAVREVQSVERSTSDYVRRLELIERGDTKALLELGAFARSRGLEGEARSAWLRVLATDAENENAWKELGGELQADGWRMRIGTRALDFVAWREHTRNWDHPLELVSAHFRILTDAPWERALDASADLERTFGAFYAALGPALELHVFEGRIEVRAFVHPADAPIPPAPGQCVWFAPSENVLYCDLHGGADPRTIAAETAEALTFNAYRRALGKSGNLEAWVRDGIARTVSAQVVAEPGRVRFDSTAVDEHAFRTQATDADALGLRRLFVGGRAPIGTGAHEERFQRAAYTWIQFLLEHESGKYRSGLVTYLRSSFLGRTGPSNLFRALGAQEAALEVEWRKFVQRQARL